MKNYKDLITLFNSQFKEPYQTILVKGQSEPIYLVKNTERTFNEIIFAHGFFSSALHEISHWCVAGESRRKIEDFGYWYKPDGRTTEEQREFESLEIKPQAFEMCFYAASGIKFNFSSDNLSGDMGSSDLFELNVKKQVRLFLLKGFPKRANQFIERLLSFYQQKDEFSQFRKKILSDHSLA